MISRIAALGLGVFLSIVVACRSEVPSRRPPRLVVVICIDHARYDFLTRFQPYFSENGFRKLTREGACFVNCRYGQATTQTAAGHAIMMSGSYPYVNGIVANKWYDRSLGRIVYAVEDSAVRIVEGGDEPAASPRRLLGTNLADQLKLHSGNRSKVFSVSTKPRSAVLMGGHFADAAYWIDHRLGRFVTSTYYMDAYPQWVREYRDRHPLTEWFGREWKPVLDPSLYPAASSTVRSRYEVKYGMSDAFPHRIGSGREPDTTYFLALRTSPFGIEAVLRFARELVIRENLGTDDTTDILCLSISPADYVAHHYGPYSAEVMDLFVRMDRDLAELFDFLDRQLGEKNILYVLTADHGGAPIPEYMSELGYDAGRVSADSVALVIDGMLARRYGHARTPQGYVAAIDDPNIYLNETALSEKNIDKNEATEYISKSLPDLIRGFFRVYAATALAEGAVIDDDISAAVARSFYPDRSGDLIAVLNPYYIWDDEPGVGTDHGQPYSYDAHVPLILNGPDWISAGTYGDACSPADIAPTVAAILGIEFPSQTDGRVLREVLKGMR